jgi:peptide/nickel transport system substrate-binding protein
VVGTIGEASNLIPLLSTDSPSHEVASYLYNGLVKYDKNLELAGDLAERWTVSPDGLTITFHLRLNVRWHDGHPFTSRDVAYTYRVTVDPLTPTAYAEDFRQVTSLTTPDPYTVVVRYDRPFAPALSSWAVSILPAHLLEGKEITRSLLIRHPVGTGPYRFRDWVAGERIVLEANDDYFEGRPHIDRYVIRVIPDSATMFMELKAGGIDMMDLTPVQYARQSDTAEFRSRFNRYRYPASRYTYMGYNLTKPLFADRRVRQALTMAINKDELVHGVQFGLGRAAHGPFKPDTWADNPQLKDIPYDPQGARRLLAEAGWRPGGDGILLRQGKPFRFTVLTNQGNAERLKGAQIIQQRLREVGIDMQIRQVEWASFMLNFIDTRDFEAVILGWSTTPDPDIFDIWHSSKTGPKELNFIGYKNPEVDRLLEQGRRTFDQGQRQLAYWRIQEILVTDQPYTFLFVPDSLVAVSRRVRGIKPAPAGIGHNIIQWYVPKSEQLR